MITAWVLTFGILLSNGQIEKYQTVFYDLPSCAREALELVELPEVKGAECELKEVDPSIVEDDK